MKESDMRLDLHETWRLYTFNAGVFVASWALGTALATAAGMDGGGGDAAALNGFGVAIGATLIATAITWDSQPSRRRRRGFEVLPAEPVDEDKPAQ